MDFHLPLFLTAPVALPFSSFNFLLIFHTPFASAMTLRSTIDTPRGRGGGGGDVGRGIDKQLDASTGISRWWCVCVCVCECVGYWYLIQ
jgi:hypothetical protein